MRSALWLGLLVSSSAAAAPVITSGPMLRGRSTLVEVTGALPGDDVALAVSARTGAGPCVRGVCLGLRNPRLLGMATADAAGRATVLVDVPASLPVSEQWAHLQAMDVQAASLSDVTPAWITDPNVDRAALLQGVSTLDLGGAVPSELVPWSDRAFPVAVDGSGTVLAAAARVNDGAVVWLAHGAMLWGGQVTSGLADNEVLVDNAIAWCGGASPTVGVDTSIGSLATWLTGRGTPAGTVDVSALATVDVFLADLGRSRSTADLDALAAFVRDGGCVVGGGQSWWWSYQNTEPAALGWPGNQALAWAGVVVSSGYGGGGVQPQDGATPLDPLDHPVDAMRRLREAADGVMVPAAELTAAVDALDPVRAHVPLAWTFDEDEVGPFLGAVPPVVPSAAAPFDPAADPLGRAWVVLRSWLDQALPAHELIAHPAASTFPGSPGGVGQTISVDVLATHLDPPDGRRIYDEPSSPVWRSTGAYALPGEVVTVTAPASWAAAGVRVRIGPHTDTLWHKASWLRIPEVSRSWPLEGAVTEVGSAFGGLVYVEVPVGADEGLATVTLDAVVSAPRFVLGQTTVSDWTTAAAAPAPWAEIEGDHFVLTVPSQHVRGLADPTDLAMFWDAVVWDQSTLSAIPGLPPRGERAVTDVQISAGYMHSGYPFMAPTSVADEFTDRLTLGSTGNWGAFHELGHGHQWGPLSWSGTTEATVNLWSLYAMEHTVGLSPRTGHPALDPAARAQRLADYVAAGANWESDWSVWVALETYLQLQEAFGWDLFIDLHALYRADDPADDPSDTQGEIDRFATRVGQLAGVDVGPFFLAWGFPLSPAVVTDLSALPPWSADPMNP